MIGEKRKSKGFFKEMTIPCGCGDNRCGKLYIQFCERNVIEINFIPYRHKKVKEGVVISNKILDKFRKIIVEQAEYDKTFEIKNRKRLRQIQKSKDRKRGKDKF